MKRNLWCAIVALLCVLLTACTAGNQNSTPKAADDVAQAIEAGQVFEELTPLSVKQALRYLDFDEKSITDIAFYMDASRATAEMIAVLTAANPEALTLTQGALLAYLDAMTEQYRDYQPAELPKLENAIRKTKGLQTVLIVSKDAQAAALSLDAIWK